MPKLVTTNAGLTTVKRPVHEIRYDDAQGKRVERLRSRMVQSAEDGLVKAVAGGLGPGRLSSRTTNPWTDES